MVRAERLEIVDAKGNPRVVMDILEDGRPSLILLDEQGVFRSWMFLSQDGSPHLVLVDNPRLVLMDKNNQVRVAQLLDGNDQPVLSLRDLAGTVRSELSLGEDGTPIARLYDADGEVIWTPLQQPPRNEEQNAPSYSAVGASYGCFWLREIRSSWASRWRATAETAARRFRWKVLSLML